MTLITLRAVKGLIKSWTVLFLYNRIWNDGSRSFIVCRTIVTEALIATFRPSIAVFLSGNGADLQSGTFRNTEVKLLVHVSISTPSPVTTKKVQYTSLVFSRQQLQSAGVTGSLVVNDSLLKS